jgi:hypothetical protein
MNVMLVAKRQTRRVPHNCVMLLVDRVLTQGLLAVQNGAELALHSGLFWLPDSAREFVASRSDGGRMHGT